MIVSVRSAQTALQHGDIKLFVGWGVDCERQFAQALGDWLPRVVPSLHVKMQQRTIDSSRRWRSDVLPKLQGSDRTIICLSPESNFSTYFSFLAGLAAASHGVENVWFYLLGLEREELRGPMRRFNCFAADKNRTQEMVRALLGPRRRYASGSIDVHWSILQKKLTAFSHSIQNPSLREGLDAIDREILISGLGG